MTPEKKVQNKIIEFLKSVNELYYERRQAGGFSYKSGLPDIWFIYKGLHCEIEVKAIGGTAGSLQLKFEALFKLSGAEYWRGDSFTDFKNWFCKLFDYQI